MFGSFYRVCALIVICLIRRHFFSTVHSFYYLISFVFGVKDIILHIQDSKILISVLIGIAFTSIISSGRF